ncbi:MAG: hypothetical protein ACR2NX_11930 [Chthoniobacterales bacterium]
MDLSLEKLKKAVVLREQIQALEQQLQSVFGGSGSGGGGSGGGGDSYRPASAPKKDGRRRPMSPATRAKLAAAARARWARQKSGMGEGIGKPIGKPIAKQTGKKPAGGITAAGRRRLSEAMKARWAERRRQQGR